MRVQQASSNSTTIPQLLSWWPFWQSSHQETRKRHDGSRFYPVVFQVDFHFLIYIYSNLLEPHPWPVDFSPAELRKLSEMPFVPVTSTGAKGTMRRLPPTQCFFSGTGGSELH